MSAGAEIKKAPPAGFLTVVRGQYIGMDGNTKRRKDYRVSVMIPLDKEKQAKSILKHKILPRKLPKAYPDFCRVRTIVIESMKDTSGSTVVEDIDLMDRDSLSRYAKSAGLPVSCDTFDSLKELRDAITLAEQSPELFIQRESKRLAERELDMELRAMNPDLMNMDEVIDLTGGGGILPTTVVETDRVDAPTPKINPPKMPETVTPSTREPLVIQDESETVTPAPAMSSEQKAKTLNDL